MDCHGILKSLTNFDDSATTPIQDEGLREALRTVYSLISENALSEIEIDRKRINNDDDAGWQYLHLILYTIKSLCDTELSEENPLLTVGQFRTIKSAVQIATCIGIIPSLLPHIRAYASKINSKRFVLKLDSDGILEKHKKLSYTVNVLMDCFDKIIFRPALISQLSCLLAALLQLSYAPLKKPDVHIDTSAQNSEFSMTVELYTQLTKEQEVFKEKLLTLIENCPQSQLIKEMMVILGIKNNPKWLQFNIKRILTGRIVLANGIGALAVAICDEVTDLGKCWDKLDITAQLVATSHGSNIEEYYNSVCPQILEMFVSDDNKQKICIANCCIKALYDYKPDLCINKIINVIMEPFLVKYNVKHTSLIKTEDEVSQSVKNLCKLFISTDAEFKCIPVSVLSRVALPLFYLHIKSFKSVYILRNRVRQLLLKILSEESIRETIYSAFLGHQEYENYEFGEKLCFSFGANGGFEITSESTFSTDYEELADCLFDLIEKDGNLAFGMFTYLLKTLPKINDTTQKVQEGKFIETTQDTIARIEKQVVAVKILTLLSSLTKVQEAQVNNPQPFLEFIEFFFHKVISNSKGDDASAYEQDSSILYTSLMLIKIILTDGNIKPTWETFQNFVTLTKRHFDFKLIPDHICSIFEEIESIVEKKGKIYSKNYVDLSTNSEKLNEFDKAVADLADPLLPVRAHGIVALTKLIDLHHPEVIAKEDFLLCIFQENLNHDDSFIYLAAINGICAMSSIFPEKVIEILVQEFIGMTTKPSNRDIFPETRAKLGEVLVKTTRALGDMTPKYKSLLVNGFLCGTRDLDPLVRASSLSCLGEFCKIMGFRLGNLIIEILYCIGCIIKTDKDDGCRRAAVLVATLLLRGLGKDALTELGENLVILYRSLKHLRDNDKDPVLQLHAQLALEEFDDIVQQFLFAKPKLEKSIFLLSN